MRFNLTASATGRIMLFGLASTSLRMLVGATSVLYLSAHGVTLAQIGLMKALQAALVLLLDLPLSYLADRRGRVPVLILGNAAGALWLAITAASTSVVGFMVGEAFNAVSLAAFNGVFSALLTETYDDEHRRRDYENVLGSFGKWQSIAMAVAAAIGACFYMNASPAVWWVAAVLLSITTLFAPRLLLAGTHRPHSHAPFKNVDASSKINRIKPTLVLAFLAGAMVGIGAAFQVLLQFWQPLVGQRLSPDDDPGWILGAAFVAFLLTQSLAAHCVRRSAGLTHGRTVQIGMLLCVTGGIALCPDISLLPMMMLLVIAFFVIKGLSIIVLAEIQREVPNDRRSSAESAMTSVTRVVFIVTMAGLGAFGDHIDEASILAVVLAMASAAFAFRAAARWLGTHPRTT